MEFIKFIIFPIKKEKNQKLAIKRDKKYGGDISYSDYEQLEKDFVSKKVHPLDVKNALAEEISSLIEPIQKDKQISKLYRDAYK